MNPEVKPCVPSLFGDVQRRRDQTILKIFLNRTMRAEVTIVGIFITDLPEVTGIVQVFSFPSLPAILKTVFIDNKILIPTREI